MKKNKILAVFILLCAFVLSGCVFPFGRNDQLNYTTPIVVQGSENSQTTITPTDIVNSCIDAVVTIFVVSSTGEKVSMGSGVAIHAGGYVLTNNHVVSLAESNSSYALKVYHNNSELSHSAEILWTNVNLDCAIIKCSCGDMPFVEMTDRFIACEQTKKLNALEQVVTIGTPIDFSLQNSCSLGYISSSSSRVSFSDGVVYEDLIQHTAPINHGNSGGPLFDMTGKLIGLNTLGHDDAHSLFFAVPVYPAMLVIDRVVSAYENNTKFTTATVGISGIDRFMSEYYVSAGLEYSNFQKEGLLVTDVTANTNAVDKMQKDDVVKAITINNVKYTINDRNDLLFAILKANKGDSVTLHFQRGLLSITQTFELV